MMNTTNQTSKFYSFSLGGQIAREIINVVFCIIIGYALRKIVKNTTMETTSKLLIGNLMMVHFLFWFSSLVRLPVVPYIYGFGCVIVLYVAVTLLYGTVLAVLAVSADWFLATRFPYQYRDISKRYTCSAIAILWICSILLCTATLYGETDENQACTPWSSLPYHGLWVFGAVVMCSTSSVIVMSSYIMKEVLRHNRSIHDTTYSRDKGFRRKMRLLRKQMETTVTFLVLSMSYCMMVVPLVIIFPLMGSGNYDDPTMITLMTIFSICSRISDPFVYILRQRILKASCCRCLPHTRFPLSEGNSTTTRTEEQTQDGRNLPAENVDVNGNESDLPLPTPTICSNTEGHPDAAQDVSTAIIKTEEKQAEILDNTCNEDSVGQECSKEDKLIETLYI